MSATRARSRVRYGDVTARRRTSTSSVADGEIVCVLGPSGSGKSTLLRAIAGLEPDATGARVAWDGADLAGVPPHRRGFGLMFQDHALFPHRDVLGNVAFGLRMQRLPAPGRSTAHTRARSRSSGWPASSAAGRRALGRRATTRRARPRARAGAAPADARRAARALDRTLRERLVAELRELFVRLELTSLFVTHDHDEAFALADRRRRHARRPDRAGRDVPATSGSDPANAFVARFLGWNVTARVRRAQVAVRPDGLALRLARRHRQSRIAASSIGAHVPARPLPARCRRRRRRRTRDRRGRGADESRPEPGIRAR